MTKEDEPPHQEDFGELDNVVQSIERYNPYEKEANDMDNVTDKRIRRDMAILKKTRIPSGAATSSGATAPSKPVKPPKTTIVKAVVARRIPDFLDYPKRSANPVPEPARPSEAAKAALEKGRDEAKAARPTVRYVYMVLPGGDEGRKKFVRKGHVKPCHKQRDIPRRKLNAALKEQGRSVARVAPGTVAAKTLVRVTNQEDLEAIRQGAHGLEVLKAVEAERRVSGRPNPAAKLAPSAAPTPPSAPDHRPADSSLNPVPSSPKLPPPPSPPPLPLRFGSVQDHACRQANDHTGSHARIRPRPAAIKKPAAGQLTFFQYLCGEVSGTSHKRGATTEDETAPAAKKPR
ncbi:hypothetical protein K470DRAFT_269480 [Piedraia hortae CBS 480.64]|uniref:Uncharacterized protein n=1 Tax=Piedraia hortae CBS 480.64 TaxID=1314780 RepID=A0A6A7C4I3_9PEZI|nr:hypothetical protein K470DRAFT_269480 [Piedraia hortae CBS 480.64]